MTEILPAQDGGVKIAGLQFSYPGQAGPPGEPFINNCNIDLPRGSRCLLVGANGAGKTTLLQVCARFCAQQVMHTKSLNV